jgi:hypothetical protein
MQPVNSVTAATGRYNTGTVAYCGLIIFLSSLYRNVTGSKMLHSRLSFRYSSVSNDTSLNGLGFLLQGIALLVFQNSYHAIVLYGKQLKTEFVSINLQILIILKSLGLQCRIHKTLVKLCQVCITFHDKKIASVRIM